LESNLSAMRYFPLLFCVLSFAGNPWVSAQEITLTMERGHEYIYNWEEKACTIDAKGDSAELSFHKKVLRMEVLDAVPGKEITLKVNLLENYREYPSHQVKNKLDYFYPDYYDDKGSDYGRDLVEEFFCRSGLIYKLNLEESTLELANWTDLLLQMSDLIQINGYSEDVRKIQVEDLKNSRLHAFSEHIWFLLEFNNTEATGRNTVKRLAGMEEIPLSADGKGNLILTLGRDVLSADNKFSRYWIDSESGLVKRMQRRICRDDKGSGQEIRWRVTKTDVSLVDIRETSLRTLHIAGKVSSPVSKKINITYLERPFGYELRKKTLFLDESDSFSIDFDFKHSGFVFLENENLNKFQPPVTFLFYAEPGDTLIFDSEGESLPRKVTFSGNRTTEARLLDTLRHQIPLPDTLRKGNSKVILDDRIFGYGLSLRNGQIIGSPRPGEVIEMLSKANFILAENKGNMSNKAFEFISNEIQSYFYNYLFSFANNSLQFRIYFQQDNPQTSEDRQVDQYIQGFDIHEVYNDYGIFSRYLTGEYLRYYFDKSKKVNTWIPNNYSTGSWKHMEQVIQFGRIVLVGSPLYREIAGRLDYDLLYQHHDPRISIDHLYAIAEQHFMFMLRSVNDTMFLAEVQNRLKQIRQWRNKDYIPATAFFDPEQKERYFSDFIGEKPVVFFVAKDWSNSRYSLDEMAAAHPEINFVMVHEGSNFKEWSDYLKAAEPVANQLFLLNDRETLLDLFEGIRAIYIVYGKDGQLIGTTRLQKQAMSMAKASLEPKRELNKSDLKWIITGLSTIIILLITGLISWKWRAKLRLRREITARRLHELELTAIRSQMNPHFLFNSLNSLQNLVQQNRAEEALSYLSDFGGIIRKVLQNSDKQEIPLSEELLMVEQYLKLEQLRFDFCYQINVEDSIDIYNTMVPSLLLQPLVENAVIHGLQSKESQRILKINADRTNDRIRIMVEDNGIGRQAASGNHKETHGKGIRLSTERLRLLEEIAGEKYDIFISDLNGDGVTGTRVEIFIPEES
jgi:hypothetical protein